MIEFRDPSNASGSRVAKEVAQDLQANQGEWGVLEEHLLPVDGNEDQRQTLNSLQGVNFPCTAETLLELALNNNANETAISLLRGAAKQDEALAADKDKPVKQYKTAAEVAKAILNQQIKRTRAAASSRTGVIKAGRGAFAPKGAYDSLQRTERQDRDDPSSPKVVRVFAMYLGKPESDNGSERAPAYVAPSDATV